MPMKLAEFAPHYSWLVGQRFVEQDRSVSFDGQWHTIVHLVGPAFTLKVEFDPLGALAWIGSEAGGWNQLCWVLSIVAPEAMPNFPESGLDREAEARALKDNLAAVTDLYRRGDLSALRDEVRRRARADSVRIGLTPPD